MNGYHFYLKNISMGYLFHSKSIWKGKICKEKKTMNGYNFRYGMYMNGSCFSLSLVYEWGGVRWLQPYVRTKNHGKLHPPLVNLDDGEGEYMGSRFNINLFK